MMPTDFAGAASTLCGKAQSPVPKNVVRINKGWTPDSQRKRKTPCNRCEQYGDLRRRNQNCRDGYLVFFRSVFSILRSAFRCAFAYFFIAFCCFLFAFWEARDSDIALARV